MFLKRNQTLRILSIVGFVKKNPTLDIFVLSTIPFMLYGCVSLADSHVSRSIFFFYIGPAIAIAISMARVYKKNFRASPDVVWMKSVARAKGVLKLVHIYALFLASTFAAAISWPVTLVRLIQYINQQRDNTKPKPINSWSQDAFLWSEAILLTTPLVAFIGSVLLYWHYLSTLDRTPFFTLDLTLAILAATSTHWIYLLNDKDVVTRLKETSGSPKVKFFYVLFCNFLAMMIVIAVEHAREASRIPELADFQAVYSSLTHVRKVATPLFHLNLRATFRDFKTLPYSATLTLFTGVPLYLVLIKTVFGGLKKQFERSDNDFISLAQYQSLRGDFFGAEQSLLKVKTASAQLEGAKCVVQLGLGLIDSALETAHKCINMVPHASRIASSDEVFWSLFNSAIAFPLPFGSHLLLLRAAIRHNICPATLFAINFAAYTNFQEKVDWYELSDHGRHESCRLVLAWRFLADKRFNEASRLLGEGAPSAPHSLIVFITLKLASDVQAISSVEGRLAYVNEWFSAVFPEYRQLTELLETGKAWEIFAALEAIQIMAILFSTDIAIKKWLQKTYDQLLVAYGNVYGPGVGGNLQDYHRRGGVTGMLTGF